MVALVMAFHGAQLMLDLAMSGLSLMVALGLFAVVATVLCSGALLHHSKPVASYPRTGYHHQSTTPRNEIVVGYTFLRINLHSRSCF